MIIKYSDAYEFNEKSKYIIHNIMNKDLRKLYILALNKDSFRNAFKGYKIIYYIIIL